MSKEAEYRRALQEECRKRLDTEIALNRVVKAVRAPDGDQIITALVEADACLEAVNDPPLPIDMILHCPRCGLQHVDEPDERTPDWTNPPHRSHLCHGCRCAWRPADVPTNGVRAIQTKGMADSWTSVAPTLRDDAYKAFRDCMSAWSNGEPHHRVVAMIESVEILGHSLDPSIHLGPPKKRGPA